MTKPKALTIETVVLDGSHEIQITKPANRPAMLRINGRNKGKWVPVHPSSLARLRDVLAKVLK